MAEGVGFENTPSPWRSRLSTVHRTEIEPKVMLGVVRETGAHRFREYQPPWSVRTKLLEGRWPPQTAQIAMQGLLPTMSYNAGAAVRDQLQQRSFSL